MSMEDNLFNLFKGLNLGGTSKMNELLKTLVTSVQINTLKKLRADLDKYIKTLQSQVSFTGEMNPYSILGVDEHATKDEVTRAFRKKSMDAHPDRGGSNEEMAKINAAYEVIRRIRGWK